MSPGRKTGKLRNCSKNLSAAQMKQEQRESHMRRSIVVICTLVLLGLGR
uniref:Uncharacterized protein n=1 Tax=Anguilla anguilla TaxID=7936 RepID=A0A0E9PTR8_ANGAN